MCHQEPQKGKMNNIGTVLKEGQFLIGGAECFHIMGKYLLGKY